MMECSRNRRLCSGYFQLDICNNSNSIDCNNLGYISPCMMDAYDCNIQYLNCTFSKKLFEDGCYCLEGYFGCMKNSECKDDTYDETHLTNISYFSFKYATTSMTILVDVLSPVMLNLPNTLNIKQHIPKQKFHRN
jgi:hypothetical protein